MRLRWRPLPKVLSTMHPAIAKEVALAAERNTESFIGLAVLMALFEGNECIVTRFQVFRQIGQGATGTNGKQPNFAMIPPSSYFF